MNINELFDNRTTRSRYTPKRTYDVRITLNKKGDHFSIRFGFINNSLKAIGEKNYAQVSNISKCRERIYFKFLNERKYLDVHKLSSSCEGDKKTSLYITITPSGKEEKIYRSDWIGKVFDIKYDNDSGFYYIEKITEKEIDDELKKGFDSLVSHVFKEGE